MYRANIVTAELHLDSCAVSYGRFCGLDRCHDPPEYDCLSAQVLIGLRAGLFARAEADGFDI